MLQQTQVARVLEPYRAWMARWPRVEDLARASRAEVIRAWAGLGYNRRAVSLHEAARRIAAEGRFPTTIEELVALPGVGRYTARAIACFAFGQPVAPVDTNVGRVVARCWFGTDRPPPRGGGELLAAADRLLAVRPRETALALMDLGALLCRPKPRCHGCPLAGRCRWRTGGYPQTEPRQRSTSPFERTGRFARGRLLALLRHRGSLALEEAAAALPDFHRPNARLYLDALVRDGLAEAAGPEWRLPGLTEG